ncbi:unnamed protein product [Amoebophrya sp. A25]|nr:unnamed protein product [Amoebophrya sp. A25]|eukprot:GSA25T00017574001.1
MRSSTTTPSPNYKDMRDPELLRYGTPDMILVANGVRLYIHSSKCAAYSKEIHQQVLHPDSFFGKMLVLRNGRSTPAAIALLDTIYSPQKVPPNGLLFEVCEIAHDYDMQLVLQKIKLGLIKRGSATPLIEAVRESVKVQTALVTGGESLVPSASSSGSYAASDSGIMLRNSSADGRRGPSASSIGGDVVMAAAEQGARPARTVSFSGVPGASGRTGSSAVGPAVSLTGGGGIKRHGAISFDIFPSGVTRTGVPLTVLEAYAEFTLHELRTMPRFTEVPAPIRLQISDTRVRILETLLHTQQSLKPVLAENRTTLFRKPEAAECVR